MLGRNPSAPTLFQMVDLEALVPPGHKLRKIDAVLDLSFVAEEVEECYADGRGRPSVDPELAVRMMLLGVIYDLSDRELCEEIQMHAGMRWFCRLNFHDPVPDHSTLSRLRNERWAQSGVFDRLMDEVVRQCSRVGMVSGRHLSVDGTKVRADASVKSLKPRGPRPLGDSPPGPGSGGGGGEPKPIGDWDGRGEILRNDTHFSTTDPDARLYRKGKNKEADMSYLVHDLLDTKSRVILRRKATQATGRAEPDTALLMVDEVLEYGEELELPNRPEILTGDKGYGETGLITALLDRNIAPHIPLKSGEAWEELPTWKRRTFDLGQKRARKQRVKEVRARNLVREMAKTRGYEVSRKLRIRSEHMFAEGKTQHGLDRARRRGVERVQNQATLTAVVQNLKRLVTFLGRKPRSAANQASHPSFTAFSALIAAIAGHIRALRAWCRWMEEKLSGTRKTSLGVKTTSWLPLTSEMARFSTPF